jgi:hypothetical protein
VLANDVPPRRCLAYDFVPAALRRVPALLLGLGLAGLAMHCEPAQRLDVVTPRRGEVVSGRIVTVTWRSAPRGSSAGDHYHVLLDRDLPAVGEPIPFDDPRIVHVVGDTTTAFRGVEPGIHRVTVVIGDASHRARGGLYRASVPFRTRDP